MNKSFLQRKFVERRFGMFIHFNSATVQFCEGEVMDWEYGFENEGEARRFLFDPADWKPGDLDCGTWADLAVGAGMKFSALTAKHHEGFCLWPTRYTEHCVRNAACKRDVVGEYFDAFRERGIVAGLYFSILDLNSGIGRKRCTAEDKEFVKNQIRELLTQYGEIPFIIIDGWAAPWGGPSFEDMPFAEIRQLVSDLQPNCLLMNIGETKNTELSDILFFESAAGQKMPEAFVGPGVSCNILNKTWFWRKDDPSLELKSAQWVADTLEELGPMNTAFILNLSPNVSGAVDANMAQRYAEIGKLCKDV